MTAAEVIKRVLSIGRCKVQLLPNCVLGAKMRKDGSARVEFETMNMTVNDLLYFSSEDKPASREPKYIGLILWVPFKDYTAITEPKREAVQR